MAQITGGKIIYSQTRQASQFEPKKAEVELSFTVSEGEGFEQIVKLAEDFAVAKVREMIGITQAAPVKTVQAAPPKPETEPVKEAPKPDTKTADEQKAAAAAARKAEKDATKTSVPKVSKPPTEKPAETGQAISTGGERVEPDEALDMSDAGTSDDDILGPVEEVVVVEVAKEITQQDLTAAITRVNQKLNNAPMIRALVAEFVGPPPKGSRDIPQDKRQAFLDKLNALIK